MSNDILVLDNRLMDPSTGRPYFLGFFTKIPIIILSLANFARVIVEVHFLNYIITLTIGVPQLARMISHVMFV